MRDDARIAGYQAALQRAGWPAAQVLDYRQVIADTSYLHAALAAVGCLRIESPGRNFDVYRALLGYGYEAAACAGVPTVAPQRLATLAHDRGLLLCPAQFHHGFQRVLHDVAGHLDRDPSLVVTSHPSDIAACFDKVRAHKILRSAGIPVARPLAEDALVQGYDDLRQRMAAWRMARVFVKLRHGSAAAGVVAFQATDRRELAITTAELIRRHDGSIAIYNSRRLCRYENPAATRALLDTLSAHGVHVEAWVPKASVDGRVCDLRIVTIAGAPRHMVLRSSRSSLTNLHLLNERRDAMTLQRRMPAAAWDSLLQTCCRVAALFPRTLHLGIDVAVQIGFREHVVLEVNAFGDLLKGVLDRGQTTYEAEVAALPTIWPESGG